ncbi:YugN-like family protein [Cytobacillus gottheilii]|uniref:YugN-like family protein n=1 Tax=Cytobacillus gottheilii TaxID=859144 RepID=UPI0009BB747B|nr:YugN-like family protein [Cytobacillus gottheilii]
MVEIPSKVKGAHFNLYKLEQQLEPMGYMIGGNWDYDHGYFDYKMDAENKGYHFLRLPFKAIDGQLDSRNCTVECGNPFILSHIYQIGLDDHAYTSNFTASFDQFSEPVDKDGMVPDEYVVAGKALVQELESNILPD